jgi:hypothetical protein
MRTAAGARGGLLDIAQSGLVMPAGQGGRVAQRESTPFTREGSQVQSLSRPPLDYRIRSMDYANLAPKFACHLCVTIDPLRVRAAHLRRRGGKAALDGVLQTPAPDGCPSMRGKRCSIRRLVHHGKRTRRPRRPWLPRWANALNRCAIDSRRGPLTGEGGKQGISRR